MNLVYFSNVSENTARFVEKLEWTGGEVIRIPARGQFEETLPDGPYILITPTYNERGVPIQVMKFLNKADNRRNMAGVIAGGNKNFGKDYCIAGDMISRKCGVPLMYKFEIAGTPEDVNKVKEGLTQYV